MEQSEGRPVATFVERAHHGLDVGRGPGRPAGGEGRLGGPDLERRGIRIGVAARLRLGSWLGGRPPVRTNRGQGELERGQCVAGRVDGLGSSRGRDRGVVDLRCRVGLVPVPCRRGRVGRQPGGQGQVVAMPLTWQQVRDDRPPDELVPEVDPRLADLDEPVLDPLGQPGREIGVDRSLAAAGKARRARRQTSLCGQLVGRGNVGQLRDRQRPARRCEQTEEAPALRGSEREAGDDEVLEAAGERGPRQLAPRRHEFLDDERNAAAPLRGQDERRSGRPLALDPLDEIGELVAPQRLDPEALSRPTRTGHGDDVGGQRVGSRHLVRLIGRDEADAMRPLDLGKERGESPGAGIGVMEVLEDEHDRLAFAQPAEDPEDAFEQSRLAPLRRRDAWSGEERRRRPRALRGAPA